MGRSSCQGGRRLCVGSSRACRRQQRVPLAEGGVVARSGVCWHLMACWLTAVRAAHVAFRASLTDTGLRVLLIPSLASHALFVVAVCQKRCARCLIVGRCRYLVLWRAGNWVVLGWSASTRDVILVESLRRFVSCGLVLCVFTGQD